MGRRISDSNPKGKKPCAFCRTMRVLVIFAVMVVILMAYANKLDWLQGVEFTSLFGYLVLLFFFVVLGYRVWDEYGRSKPSQEELEAKRAQREQQFDELDALEAERAAADRVELDEPQQAQDDLVAVEQPQQPEHDVTDHKPKANSVPEQLDLLGFSTPKKPD